MAELDPEKASAQGSNDTTQMHTPTPTPDGRAASPSKEKQPASGVELPPQDRDATLKELDSEVARTKAEPDKVLERLPPNERDIIMRQIDQPTTKVTYFTLYRFASKLDLLVILISSLCAIGGGSAFPLMTVRLCFPELFRIQLLDPDPAPASALCWVRLVSPVL